MSSVRKVHNFYGYNSVRLLDIVLEEFRKSLVYFMAEENRDDLEVAEESIVAAVDMLAHMADHYKVFPGINSIVVRRWRDIVIAKFDDINHFDATGNPSAWVYQRHNIILSAFARLEAAADLYVHNLPYA